MTLTESHCHALQIGQPKGKNHTGQRDLSNLRDLIGFYLNLQKLNVSQNGLLVV